MKKSTTIAILNFKGGVGKTTTAINLGAALALKEKKVLVVDTDFQCNTSRTLGFDGKGGTLYDVLVGNSKSLPVYEFRDGFDYIPSSPQMEFITQVLVTKVCSEKYLQRILALCADEYDYILLDCPSNGGLMNTNAMTAADYIIIPMECEMYSLQGLSRLQGQMEEVRDMLNPGLRLMGYLRTRMDKRLKMHRDVSAELESRYPDETIPVIIRSSTDLTKISPEYPTVFDYSPDSRGSHDYMELADYVLSVTE